MLSVAQAADRAGVCETVVRGWVRDGLLPHYRLGAKGSRGKIAIRPEDLDGLLESLRVGSSRPAPRPTSTPGAVFRHLKFS